MALQLDVEALPDLRDYLKPFTVPVIIDHMGRPPRGRSDPETPGLRRLIRLVEEGTCFVKLSAPYRLSRQSPPWRDVAPLARAFLEANPGACLWASDWPHPDTPGPICPEELLEALEDWCPEEQTRSRLLCRAPRSLLGLP